MLQKWPQRLCYHRGWILPPQRVWLSLWFSEKRFCFDEVSLFFQSRWCLQQTMLCKNFHLDSMNVMVLESPRQAVCHRFWFWKGCQLQECQSTELAWVPRVGMTESRPRSIRVSSRMRGKQNKQRNLSDLWLIHVAVWQRLTQYCKGNYPQFKSHQNTLFASMIMITTQWHQKR